ncbi:MAG: rhomboid family intramembrane serine protease [Cyclobacteriaceae bacterium]
MGNIEIVTGILLALNGLMTYKGLQDPTFFHTYSFRVGEILEQKDYKRLVTSAFLHGDWAHFGFNMFTLYFFANNLESAAGIPKFLFIYFGSLLGSNLFSLYIHRTNSYYSAIGASGAVSGVVFACIALFPGMEVSLFLLPFFIPAWIYGIGYVLYSIYGMKAQNDNIGHEAHLGGAILGLLIAIALFPFVLQTNQFTVIAVLVPSVAFLVYLLKKENVF